MSVSLSASRISRLNPRSPPFVLETKGSQHQNDFPLQHQPISNKGTNAADAKNGRAIAVTASAASAAKSSRAQNSDALASKNDPAPLARDSLPVITKDPKHIPSRMISSFDSGVIYDKEQFSGNQSSSGWTNESGNGMYFSLALAEVKSKHRNTLAKNENSPEPILLKSPDATLEGAQKEPVWGPIHAASPYKPEPYLNASAPLRQQQIFENYNAIMKKWAMEREANGPPRAFPIHPAGYGRATTKLAPFPHKPKLVASSDGSSSSYNWAKPQHRCPSPKVLANSLEEYYAMRDDSSHISGYVDLPVPGPTSSASERERQKQHRRNISHQEPRHKRAELLPTAQNSRRVTYQQDNPSRPYRGNYNNQIPHSSRIQQAHQRPHFNQLKVRTVNSSEPERDFNGDLMRKGRGFDGTIKHWNVPCVNQDHVGFADINAIASDYTTDCDKDSQDPTRRPTPFAPPPSNTRGVKYTTYAQLQARYQADTTQMLEKQKAEEEAAEEAGRHIVPVGSDVSNLARQSTLLERISFYLSTLDAATPDIPLEDDLDPEDYPFCYPLDPATLPQEPMTIITATIAEASEEEDEIDIESQERPDWMPTNIHKPGSKSLKKIQRKEWVKTKDGEWKSKTPKAPKYPIGKYRPGGECEWDEVPYRGSLQEIERQIMAEE